MPTPAAVKRDLQARRARLQRVLRESARDRAPLPTVRHVKRRALALAFGAGVACTFAMFAFIALAR